MIGHLGTRASALLDGQLPPAEAERLWAHVHGCHLCRDLVEREGWIKTQLSGLGAPAQAPDHLKGALLDACSTSPLPPATSFADVPARSRARTMAMVGVGVGSAAGMAVMGVLALGVSPADAPAGDPQAPIANLTPPTEGGSTLLPVRDRRP